MPAKSDHRKPDTLRKAIDRLSHKGAIEAAIAKERARCAKIARFAEVYCTTDLAAGVARAIAEAIENPAIGG
jgi:hypothetical protein